MLSIPYLHLDSENSQMEEVSSKLELFAMIPIATAPWKAYPYTPAVKFAIAHSGDALLVKYKVRENSILAVHRKINQAVYKDACVELFIAFDDNGYYNLEFNCVGNCLAAYGPDRHSRQFLPVYLIKELGIKSSINTRSEDGQVDWELSLKIPLSVFYKHEISSLDGRDCRLNLYKCGDDLPEPHFLTWSNIISEEPDFHLPQFFGAATFAYNPIPKPEITKHLIKEQW
jgi:hypothetical protein